MHGTLAAFAPPCAQFREATRKRVRKFRHTFAQIGKFAFGTELAILGEENLY